MTIADVLANYPTAVPLKQWLNDTATALNMSRMAVYHRYAHPKRSTKGWNTTQPIQPTKIIRINKRLVFIVP